MKNLAEKSPLVISHKLIQQRFNLASNWSIAGLILCLMLIVSGYSFMNWLQEQSSYSFGTVINSIPIKQSTNTIAQLQSPFKKDYVMNENNPSALSLGDWVFVYGERIGQEEPQILITMEQATLPVLGAILSTPANEWLSNLAGNKHLALIMAVILLIWSGKIFQWAYTIVISSAAYVTLWHALYFARWNNLLNLSDVSFVVLIILFLAAFVPLINKHKQFEITGSLFAAGAWLITSASIQLWMGWSDTWVLIMFLVALISPRIIAAIIAAYLLSKSLDASVLGGYGLIMLCAFITLSQWINSKYVKVKVRALRSRFFKSSQKYKGRVTLAELLNQN